MDPCYTNCQNLSRQKQIELFFYCTMKIELNGKRESEQNLM